MVNLAESLNQMTSSLRFMIIRVLETSKRITATAEELTVSSKQTTRATQNIVLAIQEVASGTGDTSKTVKEMVSGIQQVSAGSQVISSSTLHTKNVANGGSRVIGTAIQQINTARTTVDVLAKSAFKLGERSNEIGQIVDPLSKVSTEFAVS